MKSNALKITFDDDNNQVWRSHHSALGGLLCCKSGPPLTCVNIVFTPSTHISHPFDHHQRQLCHRYCHHPHYHYCNHFQWIILFYRHALFQLSSLSQKVQMAISREQKELPKILLDCWQYLLDFWGFFLQNFKKDRYLDFLGFLAIFLGTERATGNQLVWGLFRF